MSTITTRAGKGSALTHNQLDTNFKKAAQAKTGAYTVAESDNRDTIECSGTFSVTMPDVATVVAAADTGDFEVTLKNTGSGIITVGRTTGTDTIDGTAANITLAANKSVTLKCNQAGAGYNIISSNPSVEYGTHTFSSLASGATSSAATIAQSLGTDDIDIYMTVRGSPYSVANGSYSVVAVAMRPDAGAFAVNTSNAVSAQPTIISLPSSGNFALRVRNDSSVTQDVIVDYTLRPRG